MSKMKPLLNEKKTFKSSSWLSTHRKIEEFKNVHHQSTRKSKVKRRNNKKKVKKTSSGYPGKGHTGPHQYTFYSIINTDYSMSVGSAAAKICRGVLTLHEQLASGSNEKYLEDWEDDGERIVVFRGYNNRHLLHVKNAVAHIAVDLHTLYRKWGTMRVIVVLTIFGQDSELDEYFSGLERL